MEHHVESRLWPAAAVRIEVQNCRCEHDCGGWLLAFRPTDDLTCFPGAQEQEYEHLSRSELLDVVDAVMELLV